MMVRALRQTLPTIMFAIAALVLASATVSSQTLKEVKDRGSIVCGVNEGLAGFASADDKGVWSGLDVDFCRAVAAAVLGDPAKVQYVPVSADVRFDALRDHKIDLLSRNSTWTMSRETQFGVSFVGVTYYDGQGFLIRKAADIKSALDLEGAKVCVQSGTTTIENLKDFFASNSMTYTAFASPSSAEALKNYEAGVCSVLTTDVSGLYALRLQLAKPGDHLILPDIISKEPLGPAVRQADPQWLEIVKWVNFAMLDAEEIGVSSKTIEQALKSTKPEVMRLVGTDGDFGEQIGLTKGWAANAIRLVGNYGEVYERNVGAKSKLGIPRGLNELWNRGGIQYAPPIR
jgi:general L-amino acid transport system substrate-binding protein